MGWQQIQPLAVIIQTDWFNVAEGEGAAHHVSGI